MYWIVSQAVKFPFDFVAGWFPTVGFQVETPSPKQEIDAYVSMIHVDPHCCGFSLSLIGFVKE